MQLESCVCTMNFYVFMLRLAVIVPTSSSALADTDGGQSTGTRNQDGGLSKTGGVLTDLPPCEVQGGVILHTDRSCVYLPSDADTSTNVTSGRAGMTRGGAGDVTGSRNNNLPEDPYDRDGRYWLVPPFLIGATLITVGYIIIHCLYLHCYTKRKIRQMSSQSSASQAVIFTDGDGPSTSSMFTPMMQYDFSDQRVESQPFIIYNPSEPSTSRKASFISLLSRKKSTASTAGFTTPRGRASICFVPVSRTISAPSTGATTTNDSATTPVPKRGTTCPRLHVPHDSSAVSSDSCPRLHLPNTSASSDSCSQMVSHQSDGDSAGDDSTKTKKASRKTSFREPESDTVVFEIGSSDDSDD